MYCRATINFRGDCGGSSVQYRPSFVLFVEHLWWLDVILNASRIVGMLVGDRKSDSPPEYG